jgi:PAS domain-containing protein
VQQHGEKQTCTLTLKRSDGSTFPARLEGKRITRSDGTITVRVVISDITDIWQIEALRESEEKFRILLLHVPSIAVQGYSMDGTTNYWYDGAENFMDIVQRRLSEKTLSN